MLDSCIYMVCHSVLAPALGSEQNPFRIHPTHRWLTRKTRNQPSQLYPKVALSGQFLAEPAHVHSSSIAMQQSATSI